MESSTGGQPPTPGDDADASPATEETGADTAAVRTPTRPPVEELLRRLEESVRVAPAEGAGGLTRVVTDAAGHADTLRETLTAQQEAQELLAVAQKVRASASSQAEKVVREARDAAERVAEESRRHAEQSRLETAAWAQEQRARVEKLIGDLVDSATRDADRIREEAVAEARAEAEEAGAEHLARARAQGARDAEAIRDEARRLLRESATTVSLATATLQGLSGTVSEVSERLGVQVHALELLTQEVGVDAEPEPDLPPEPAGTDEARAADEIPGEKPTEEPTEEPTDEPTDEATDEPSDEASDEPSDEPTDEPTDDAPAPPPAPREGRPLGSLFGGPDGGAARRGRAGEAAG